MGGGTSPKGNADPGNPGSNQPSTFYFEKNRSIPPTVSGPCGCLSSSVGVGQGQVRVFAGMRQRVGPGVCDKPRIKCGDCGQRLLLPVTDQDTLPKGGFGNLIALPLQKQPREQGCSVFVGENYLPYPDQWAFLASIRSITRIELENAILLATGGKKKPTGKIDIAVMQSLSRRGDPAELLDKYDHIIVDECHHIPAFSFEAILKQAEVRQQHRPSPEIPPESRIQDVFRILANDAGRNRRVAKDILSAYKEGQGPGINRTYRAFDGCCARPLAMESSAALCCMAGCRKNSVQTSSPS